MVKSFFVASMVVCASTNSDHLFRLNRESLYLEYRRLSVIQSDARYLLSLSHCIESLNWFPPSHKALVERNDSGLLLASRPNEAAYEVTESSSPQVALLFGSKLEHTLSSGTSTCPTL
jgi:RecB family endonuclease NucS